MTGTVRPYRGVSAEQRTADRRRRMITAVLEVVGRDGVRTVTVDAVCRDAGLTKRYFYESFSDLDALLVAALDDAFRELEAAVVGQLRRRRTPERRARAIIEILIDTMAGDPRLARLYVEAPAHDGLRARREEAVVAFSELLLTQLSGGRPHTPRPALAVRLVVAGTTDLVTGWLSGSVSAERADVVETVVAAGLFALRRHQAGAQVSLA